MTPEIGDDFRGHSFWRNRIGRSPSPSLRFTRLTIPGRATDLARPSDPRGERRLSAPAPISSPLGEKVAAKRPDEGAALPYAIELCWRRGTAQAAAGLKLSATPLMQWRRPVGAGPSSKTWPR
ncbi:hypothetical protein EOA27_08150 [Mesorhizobium sp. M2A.F.Ca.ET.037.01.1.1]|nr:hypothetical protein EOA27_08150 [Mesorhizobium sp. M2A.F.Ca.ET.037.01.1.1]RUY10024.1 hypothetical protein EOA25_09765 [Mesorhizobium sp. M2A.F.Ca.ET.040.01.1.1]RVC67623.1 hypothetical protein EN759_14700 [Mesorhizobium sp. M00.F.Ca.ET.038.03.1.1]RVC79990.1 hypothetical protein EN766_06165 [Mesorhizobium sp. M2A.F.Ca.ET.046.02.1.1]RWA88795.1 MAG: hypothetical protein EOQ31_19240 [Mesorhizobium sp.]RWX62720.1 hypothetical protein EOA24_27140 [Mesorhizobium sp. M2A.F.Ca.ET.039.01.1.1]